MTYDGWGSQGKGPPFEGADAIPPGYGPPNYPAPTYPPPSYPPPPGYGPPGGYSGYGPPPQGYGMNPGASYPASYAPRTDGTATLALVLAISSFVVCPVMTAIVALALIPGSRRTITSSGGSITGLGLLTAAKIVAWINIAFVAVMLVFGLFLLRSQNVFSLLSRGRI